ncbi:uncharacterized protein LOC103519287 [Diaphorina citri]|uniref:Uncharacterized protein LOC103519287 n=1 Tax=Diaphorina citri TaxID=121845 RepID=A0A3Q0JHQ7_DIACI|nr:uncharacterized protein LOC103519287 [Diaphorina citri]
MKARSNKTSSFSDDQLLVLLLDLFMAGSETTSNSLSFSVLYLIRYPHVQRKIQEEIDSLNKEPTILDRYKCPYLEATIMEIMRHGNTAPIGVAHRAMKTSRLGSYVIPQDSIILVNLWSIMRDQEHWGDPDVFRPERFIHPTSGEVLYDETLIPFGLGKKTLDKKTILRKTAQSTTCRGFTPRSIEHNTEKTRRLLYDAPTGTNGCRCQPSSIRLVDNVQLKAGQFFRPDPGYLELLTDGLKKLYVTKILGFRDDEMCAATVLFEGDPEDVKNNEDKIYSIAKRYGGIPAGESNGRRGYMLTYIIAYIRDFACDYYFIGDSFETSVPWDKTVLLCINVKKRLTRECTDDQLLVLLLDLFMAGSETTSNSLSFSVLYLIRYPHVQRKIQEEIDSLNKEPTILDRYKCPYLEATIMEIMRHGNTAPIGVAHRAMKTSRLGSYVIPQDSIILVNLWSIMRDQEHWGDPDVFRPERFIHPTSGEVLYDETLIPFGLGKRRCLGEPMARTSLFIFLSSLLYHFNISIPSDEPLPAVTVLDGVTLAPAPYKAPSECTTY